MTRRTGFEPTASRAYRVVWLILAAGTLLLGYRAYVWVAELVRAVQP